MKSLSEKKGLTVKDVDSRELEMGIKEEMHEHGMSRKEATKTALDHFTGDKKYYTHMKHAEAKMEKIEKGIPKWDTNTDLDSDHNRYEKHGEYHIKHEQGDMSHKHLMTSTLKYHPLGKNGNSGRGMVLAHVKGSVHSMKDTTKKFKSLVEKHHAKMMKTKKGGSEMDKFEKIFKGEPIETEDTSEKEEAVKADGGEVLKIECPHCEKVFKAHVVRGKEKPPKKNGGNEDLGHEDANEDGSFEAEVGSSRPGKGVPATVEADPGAHKGSGGLKQDTSKLMATKKGGPVNATANFFAKSDMTEFPVRLAEDVRKSGTDVGVVWITTGTDSNVVKKSDAPGEDQ